MIAEKYLNIFILGFVEVVEGGAELVELLLSDALAVAGQDLVLHLVDRSKIKTLISGSLSVSLSVTVIVRRPILGRTEMASVVLVWRGASCCCCCCSDY